MPAPFFFRQRSPLVGRSRLSCASHSRFPPGRSAGRVQFPLEQTATIRPFGLRLDPLQPGRLALRLGNLALGVQTRLRIYASDGTTIRSKHNPEADREGYFFVVLTVVLGQPVFVEVTDQDGQASAGLYSLSACPPYAAEIETAVHLPLVLRR